MMIKGQLRCRSSFGQYGSYCMSKSAQKSTSGAASDSMQRDCMSEGYSDCISSSTWLVVSSSDSDSRMSAFAYPVLKSFAMQFNE